MSAPITLAPPAPDTVHIGPVTLYAPLTKAEATYWHKRLSEIAGVQMQQNPEVDSEGRHHTFFTLLADELAVPQEGPA